MLIFQLNKNTCFASWFWVSQTIHWRVRLKNDIKPVFMYSTHVLYSIYKIILSCWKYLFIYLWFGNEQWPKELDRTGSGYCGCSLNEDHGCDEFTSYDNKKMFMIFSYCWCGGACFAVAAASDPSTAIHLFFSQLLLLDNWSLGSTINSQRGYHASWFGSEQSGTGPDWHQPGHRNISCHDQSTNSSCQSWTMLGLSDVQGKVVCLQCLNYGNKILIFTVNLHGYVIFPRSWTGPEVDWLCPDYLWDYWNIYYAKNGPHLWTVLVSHPSLERSL